MRRNHIVFLVGLLALLGYAAFCTLPALEVHRGFKKLQQFEKLMSFGMQSGRVTEPESPPVLIVQHIWKRGPIEAASERTHSAYARAWGYGYRSDTTDYVTDGRHPSLNKVYTLLAAMELQMKKEREQRPGWILYCDADTVISDPSVPIEMLLPPSTVSPLPRILGNEDDQGFNGGVMLFRVDEETHGFLKLLVADELKWSPNLSDEHRIHTVLRSNQLYAEYFYLIPQEWFNAYQLPEPESPWHPRLHVHFVKQLKKTGSIRPVLNQATRIAQRGIDRWWVTKAGRIHPIRILSESNWTKTHGEEHWATAVAGIHGMWFLDEEVGKWFNV